jgi:hypothetical protein
VFKQDFGAAVARIRARRRGLCLDLVGGDSRLGQSGSDSLRTVESGAKAVQLLNRAA